MDTTLNLLGTFAILLLPLIAWLAGYALGRFHQIRQHQSHFLRRHPEATTPRVPVFRASRD